jgi:hypothetical protein
MPYERARAWLEQYVIDNRDDAEAFLASKGENVSSTVWQSVLNDLFPEGESPPEERDTGNEGTAPEEQNEIGQEEKEDEQRTYEDEHEGFLDKASSFIRGILNGLFSRGPGDNQNA